MSRNGNGSSVLSKMLEKMAQHAPTSVGAAPAVPGAQADPMVGKPVTIHYYQRLDLVSRAERQQLEESGKVETYQGKQYVASPKQDVTGPPPMDNPVNQVQAPGPKMLTLTNQKGMMIAEHDIGQGKRWYISNGPVYPWNNMGPEVTFD